MNGPLGGKTKHLTSFNKTDQTDTFDHSIQIVFASHLIDEVKGYPCGFKWVIFLSAIIFKNVSNKEPGNFKFS